MITTVTLNPAIDRTIVVDQFEFGSVNRVQSVREDMGGKGINVARILLALGSEAQAIGFMGQSNLGHVQNLLQRDAIPTDFVLINAATRLNTKLIEARSHTTTDINEAGFTVSAHDLEAMKTRINQAADQSEFIVFSGSVPKGLPTQIYGDLIGMINGPCKTVLDADGVLLLEGLKSHPYLIKPNIHELESALGRTLETPESIVAAARDLIRLYQITYVLVSMGGDGSILVTPDRAFFAAPIKVEVRGTVGAGDSMLAGFVHCLASGFDSESALAWATACGALAVSKVGTESFTRAEVETLAGKVQIKAI